jgi:mannose-1-phosphate guanylyltransferase
MRAFILAAGLGTRLRPLTNKIPKCMVPISHTPLLEIWVRKLHQANINQILINTHYMSDVIDDHFQKHPYRSLITLSYEKELLGTAGSIVKNIDFMIGDDCLIMHADNYSDMNLLDLIDAHKKRPVNCLMTMLTFRTDNPSECGIIEINELGIVTGFYEKIRNPPGNLANGAIYIFSKELIETFANKYFKTKDISFDILPSLIGKIYTYETNEVFIDIGKIENYQLAVKFAKEKNL